MKKFSRRRLVVSLLGLGAGAGLLSGCSQYLPQGRTPASGLSRATIIAKINETRAANGRPPLRYSAILARAAQTHTDLMAANGELSHTLGGSLRERVTEAGYIGAVGENLAGGQRTLEGAIRGWLESATHRSTLLSPRFTEFGLGVSSGTKGQKTYWAIILGGDFAAWQRQE